jgi:hypothetical protein
MQDRVFFAAACSQTLVLVFIRKLIASFGLNFYQTHGGGLQLLESNRASIYVLVDGLFKAFR